MSDWCVDNRDSQCHGYMPAQDGVAPYLYIACVNAAPEDPNLWVQIRDLALETDAPYVWCLGLSLPEGWPPTVTKYQAVHMSPLGSRVPDRDGKMQPGINTEIVHSRYAPVLQRPAAGIEMQMVPSCIPNPVDIKLMPGQALLFVPAVDGSHLGFGLRLIKYTPLPGEVKKN